MNHRGFRTGRRSRGRIGGRRGQGGYGSNCQQNTNVEEQGIFAEAKFDWDKGTLDEADTEMRNLFINKVKFSAHYEAQKKYPVRYYACLLILIKNHVQIVDSSKAMALAATWVRRDYLMAEFLLMLPDELFSIKEVLKALTTLDASRTKRATEKILKRLEAQGCKKKSKISLLKSLIGSLEADIPSVGSVSGALIRHVKLWAKTIPAERLEFFAMHFPPEPWKKLADLCHLNAEKDFPQCPWFLKFCFGEATVPETSVVAETLKMSESNISDMVMLNDLDYTVVRKWHTSLTPEAKERIAKYSKMETVLWYYEEIECEGVDKVIYERLESGEESNLPYGKLMERIMYCSNIATVDYGDPAWGKSADWSDWGCSEPEAPKKPRDFVKFLTIEAERNLGEIKFNLEEPVVVIGDMSGSMNVAIRTSNIIASLVAAVAHGELVFFDEYNVIPPFIPKDVEGVMQLCKEIQARGSTIPAVSLYPYYEKKKIVKTFVIVTDEGENGFHNGYRFGELFKKYYDEIYPARLVFISFLSQGDKGQMVQELQRDAPYITPMQFRFNVSRPDLTKLDNVFGTLSSANQKFSKQVDDVEKLFIAKKLNSVLEVLKI